MRSPSRKSPNEASASRGRLRVVSSPNRRRRSRRRARGFSSSPGKPPSTRRRNVPPRHHRVSAWSSSPVRRSRRWRPGRPRPGVRRWRTTPAKTSAARRRTPTRLVPTRSPQPRDRHPPRLRDRFRDRFRPRPRRSRFPPLLPEGTAAEEATRSPEPRFPRATAKTSGFGARSARRNQPQNFRSRRPRSPREASANAGARRVARRRSWRSPPLLFARCLRAPPPRSPRESPRAPRSATGAISAATATTKAKREAKKEPIDEAIVAVRNSRVPPPRPAIPPRTSMRRPRRARFSTRVPSDRPRLRIEARGAQSPSRRRRRRRRRRRPAARRRATRTVRESPTVPAFPRPPRPSRIPPRRLSRARARAPTRRR